MVNWTRKPGYAGPLWKIKEDKGRTSVEIKPYSEKSSYILEKKNTVIFGINPDRLDPI